MTLRPVLLPGESHCVYTQLATHQMAHHIGNMGSSTKAEVRNILYCRQRFNMHRKFRDVWTCRLQAGCSRAVVQQ